MRKVASIIVGSILLLAWATGADGDGTSHEQVLAKGAGGTPSGSLTGGTLRLDPLLPGGGGIAASAQFLLFGSVGQSTVTPSYGNQFILRPGFWTPVDAIAADRVFSDGFE